MACIDQTDSNNLLNAVLHGNNYTAPATLKIKLGTTAPTSTSNMTELTGTGYTAGGTTATFNAASAGATSNSSTATWTNTSGGNWTGIVGIEIWDTGGPTRHMYGNWTGQPIVVANGNSFAIAAAGVAISLV
jgi:hypothetical protein